MGGTYYTGCAVWAYKDWVGSFYPPGSRASDFLRLYCDRMTAVEGNTTFYSLPSPATVERWATTMPADFRFCPKLPRCFSHQGHLRPHLEAAISFAESLTPLGPRLGPLLLQLPPRYGPSMAPDLQAFLAAWPRQRFPLAVEVRHRHWFTDAHRRQLNDRLRALQVSRALLDTRPIYETADPTAPDPQLNSERKKPQLPLQPDLTAPFTLIRYIGHPDMAVNAPYLAEWVRRLQQWLHRGQAIYFFAHCPQEVQSPAIARQTYHQLQAAGTPLPSLKWDQAAVTDPSDEAPSQLSLF